MSVIEVTSPGGLKMVLGLNIKKSIGPDEISQYVVKAAALEFCLILTYIFNCLLSSSEVPNHWRLANIFALHKKGAMNLPENYRV